MGKLADYELLAILRYCPPVPSAWRHYKTGNTYHIVDRAIQESTQEPLVIYRAHGQFLLRFARPLAEWEEMVEWQGQTVPRFTQVD